MNFNFLNESIDTSSYEKCLMLPYVENKLTLNFCKFIENCHILTYNYSITICINWLSLTRVGDHSWIGVYSSHGHIKITWRYLIARLNTHRPVFIIKWHIMRCWWYYIVWILVPRNQVSHFIPKLHCCLFKLFLNIYWFIFLKQDYTV